MRPGHTIGIGAVAMLAAIAAILLFGPPWVRTPIIPPDEQIAAGPPIGRRLAEAVLFRQPAPYLERRSECELLNSGYGLPFCDSYGPDYALYRQERPLQFADDDEEYGVNPYSRGYGVEGRGWQLP